MCVLNWLTVSELVLPRGPWRGELMAQGHSWSAECNLKGD